MIWIILALTLGASITSIIHGVFMLFGSLSISGAAIPGIPSTMLAVLPVISAIFALIGGIIAFNQSKWGALFLLIAMGLCAPSRDTWLYGGLYFFAGLFCFFLKSKREDEYPDLYDYDEDSDREVPYSQDFYYEEQPPVTENVRFTQPEDVDVVPQPNNEPPKLRRRMSKSCPECGAVVSRDAFYCPTCGAKLFVVSEDAENAAFDSPVLEHEPLDTEADIQSVNNQLFAPPDDGTYGQDVNYADDENVYDMGSVAEETVPDYRVAVKPRMQEAEIGAMGAKRRTVNVAAKDAAASYKEFSRYANRGKKPRRSMGRKVLSMMLLVGGVGVALYFLLGLRKLPPGELPPMNDPVPVPASQTSRTADSSTTSTPVPSDVIAEPGEVTVAENMLPDFTPERTPKTGAVIGSNVNVRADHNTTSSKVTRLSVGTRVEVLGTFNVPSGQYSGIWYNIRTSGKEGWVYGRYLQPLGSGLPNGYSNALLRSFGSTKSQLVEALGNPTRSTSSSVEWPGLTATVKGEDITRIRLNNANRELQNGLKVGMSQTALLQVMGYPSSVNNRTLNYNESGKTGLSVQLDRNNAVSTITVNELQ